MDARDRATATILLTAARAGDATARARLVTLVYDELRPLAGGLMGRERAGHTLQPTALVHEALLRLFDREVLHTLENRAHFLNAAAQAMRRILVDHARARATHKRGGSVRRVPLDDMLAVFEDVGIDLLGLNEALNALAAENPRGHRPRWRISDESLQAFERRRAAVPPAPAPRRRRKPDHALVEYV